jgi:hypothetical protein
MQVFGFCMAILFGLAWAMNGAFMLVSPRAWFRLPRWLGVHGQLAARDYASGGGALVVRLLGGICLAIIAWVLYDMLSR